MASEAFTWEGEVLVERVRRAYGRALIGIGEAVATEGKRWADVVSGTMMRSIHVTKLDHTGGNDYEDAQNGFDLGEDHVNEPTWESTGAAVQVGSWVPYACVEEVGRGHAFMAPAVEDVQGARAEALMERAFGEEGLL